MKLLNIYSLKGPNIYSYKPVIVMEMDLQEYREVHTDELPQLVNSLLELFPGLHEHCCSPGYPGGFVERLQRGTLLGHVTEHLALELQSIVAEPVKFGKTRFADEINAYRLVFACHSAELGLAAGKKAFTCIDSLLKGETVDAQAMVEELREIYNRTSYGTSTQALLNSAQKRGIPVISLSKRSSLIQLGYGAKQRRIQATTTDRTSCIAVDLACDKWETRQILKNMGLPVARGYLVSTEEEALEALQSLGKPAVVKPLDGNQGKGVTLNITTPADLEHAFLLGKKYSNEILIEEFIKGNDYRLTIVNGRMVAASHRLPPLVTGDGVHTIRELIEELNTDARRGDDHEKPLTRIKVDQVILFALQKQGLTLDSVLKEGQELVLRENGNLSTGGTASDVTELVHPENRRLVERAVRIIGLDIAGVDIRTEDISEPITYTGGAILEINAAPGIRMHHYPAAGQERNVADNILDMLFGEDNGRIPLFAITGTNGKTTTTRLIQHILLQTGQTVGMTTTDGVYINNELIYAGDTTGPWSANLLLCDPSVDIAVLETARGGIIKSGLAYQQCDVGVVLNVSEDHLGLHGMTTLEDLAHVKSLIVELVSTDGVSVLNADNPYTVQMMEKAKGKIILFSVNPDNPALREHVEAGGMAVVAHKGMVEVWQAHDMRELIAIAEVPMTHRGRARHQVENMLAAIAAVLSFGVQEELLHRALLSFNSDIETNPGRLNIVEGPGWQVILDYGHNVEAYRSILQFAEASGCRRLLGVIGVPGDRQDESILKVGQLAGDYFDRVWIKEDLDLRGRKEGEVAELLAHGLLHGQKTVQYEIVHNEKEAFHHMLEELAEGDIGIIFYEKNPQSLLRLVKDFLERTGTEENTPVLLNSSL